MVYLLGKWLDLEDIHLFTGLWAQTVHIIFFTPCSSSVWSNKIVTNLSNVTSTSFPSSGITLRQECSFLKFLALSFTSEKKMSQLLNLSALKFSRLKIEIAMAPTIVWNIPSKLIRWILTSSSCAVLRSLSPSRGRVKLAKGDTHEQAFEFLALWFLVRCRGLISDSKNLATTPWTTCIKITNQN